MTTQTKNEDLRAVSKKNQEDMRALILQISKNKEKVTSTSRSTKMASDNSSNSNKKNSNN